MKHSKNNEEIFERLADVDDDLLEAALKVDNANELEKYANTKKHSKSPMLISPAFRRAIVSAACFILTVGLVLGGSFIYRMDNTGDPSGGDGSGGQEHEQINGDIENETQKDDINGTIVELNSLDKINYYAAVKMTGAISSNLSNSSGVTSSYVSKNYASSKMQFLSGTTESGTDEIETIEDDEYETDDVFETETENPNDNEDSHLLDLPFVITTAIYFETEVSEDCEPLASLIGTGRVGVVITDLHVNGRPRAMITFKKGDKYFHCITQMRDLVQGINHFNSNIYIEGEDLKKDNSRCDLTSFIIDLDLETGEIVSAEWKPYSNTPTMSPSYPFSIYEDTVKISKERYTFSIESLESYYLGIGMEVASPKDTEDQIKTDEILITAGREKVEPRGYMLWRQYYDGIPGYCTEEVNESIKQWLIPSIEEGSDIDIPVLNRMHLMDMFVGDGGKVISIEVYHTNDEGKIVPFDGLHIDGTIYPLDWLDIGEWYVIITVEWQGEYIEEANMYETSCKEYIFKLIV